MDIFGSTATPRWIDPDQQNREWRSQYLSEDQAQTQKALGFGRLALEQQQQALNEKVQGVAMVGQGYRNQIAQRDLANTADDQTLYTDSVKELNTPEDWLNAEMPAFKTSQFTQQWLKGRDTAAQTLSGAAIKSTQATSLATIAQMKAKRISDADAAFKVTGINPYKVDEDTGDIEFDGHGLPIVDPDAFTSATQKMAEIAQKRAVEVRQAGPEITSAGRERVATINADARRDVADIAADWHTQIATAKNQSQIDQTAMKLNRYADTFFNDIDKQAFKEQSTAIAHDTATPIAERSRQLNALKEKYKNAHRNEQPAPAAQPAATNAPAGQDDEAAKALAAIKSGKDPDAVRALYKKKTGKDLP